MIKKVKASVTVKLDEVFVNAVFQLKNEHMNNFGQSVISFKQPEPIKLQSSLQSLQAISSVTTLKRSQFFIQPDPRKKQNLIWPENQKFEDPIVCVISDKVGQFNFVLQSQISSDLTFEDKRGPKQFCDFFASEVVRIVMFLKGDSRLLRLQFFNKNGVCLVDAGKKDSGSKFEVQL